MRRVSARLASNAFALSSPLCAHAAVCLLPPLSDLTIFVIAARPNFLRFVKLELGRFTEPTTSHPNL